MLTCTSCGNSNPDGYRFCGRCGALLEGTPCPSCGSANPAGQSFCGRCGLNLADVADLDSAPLDERKLATVLFADVVGFTSLAERTDPELVARMVDAAFSDLARVVTEHGGTVDKYMGDSLMALFGVPVAHDDDAERAVAAGLAMRRLGGDLVFSIGINSGEVMATSMGNGGLTVIGDAVNVAARLEKAAAPGEVLCGSLTADLARHRVEFAERQPVLLKGKSEPVEVFQALRLRRLDGSVADEAPLIGRDDEIAFLEMQWRRVRDERQAKLVVLCGEAGSGKTRLLDELGRIVGSDATIIRAAYPAYGVLGGIRVAADLIDQLGSSEDPEVESRVRSVMGELDPGLADMDLTGVRSEQLWGIGKLLKEKAKSPLVIMIDDLHWGDERTLGLLGEVATRMRDVPIMTVVAGRTDPSAWLARFTAASTLRLSPLAPSHAAALATCMVGDKELSEEARDFLVEMTNGNPLYLRELVSVALARQVLVDDGSQYRLTANAGIPVTLQALLAARLDALERSHKSTVQYLAVLGEADEKALVELGIRDAASQLAALTESGLVRPTASVGFEITDPLLREVAYDMLPRNIRGDLHRRAASIVGTAEERVRHLERASDYLTDDQELVDEAAAALAVEGMALIKAARHLDAMRVLEKSVALGTNDPNVLLELARIQGLCGREDDALATFALVADDPDDPSLAAERDHQMAVTRMFSDPGSALPDLLQAAEQWHRLGNTTKEAWGYANAGVANFYLSRMEESATLLERGLALFESVGDKAGAVASSSFMCLARPEDPRVDQWLDEALKFADETGDRGRQTGALATLTWKHFFSSLTGRTSDMVTVERFGDRLSGLAQELGAADMAMHGLSLVALTTRFTGRFDEAAARISSLQRMLSRHPLHEPWLAWAATFVVAMATGTTNAAPPYPPPDAVDPVLAMARLVIEIELLLAGRVEDAMANLEAVGPPALEGPLSDVGGLVYAVGLVLAGRGDEALPWARRAFEAAKVLYGGPPADAATALMAEITGDGTDLPPMPEAAGGIADGLVLRAHAVLGDPVAAERLRQAAASLAAPGLLRGI